VQADRVIRPVCFECPAVSRRTPGAKAPTRVPLRITSLVLLSYQLLDVPAHSIDNYPIQRFNRLDFRNARDAIAGASRYFDAPMTFPAAVLSKMFQNKYREHRWIVFGARQTAQDICRAISNRLCCVPADVCESRGTWSSKIARSPS
jgi:hypothetical protein